MKKKNELGQYQCTRCEEFKEEELFGKKRNHDGVYHIASTCKSCDLIRSREHRQRLKDSANKRIANEHLPTIGELIEMHRGTLAVRPWV